MLRPTPEWLTLQRALHALIWSTSSHHGYIVDVWGTLWCTTNFRGVRWPSLEEVREAEVVRTYVATSLSALEPPLTRGGRFVGTLDLGSDELYVRTFASVYALVLVIGKPLEVASVRNTVARALPKIEALTIALPPPDGPGAGGAQGFGAA